jgi:predicted nucleic acid-binding protein
MIIVDTTIWVDYFAQRSTHQTRWLDRELPHLRFGLTDIILCELLQGVRQDRLFRELQNEMERFEIFSTGGKELAVASARSYRILRQRGITVRKTIDCMIATFCIREGHSLLHNDRDFDPFENYMGLKVIHPEDL